MKMEEMAEKFMRKIRGTENPMVPFWSTLLWSVIIIALTVYLSGCSAGEPLPPIEGPWYQLNSDRWQPNEAELQQIKGLPEK
jgi:heme A synthase